MPPITMGMSRTSMKQHGTKPALRTVSGHTSNNSTLSQGSVIGIVVGCVAAILLLLVGAFLFLRRRRTHTRLNPFRPRSAKPRLSPSPGIPIQNPPDIEAQYDATLDEKEPLTAERRSSDEYGSRRLSDDYYPRTVTAHLVAFPSEEPNDRDIVPSARLSPAPGLLSPGIPPSGRLSPGISPSGRLSPGIPPSGRLSPGIPPSGRLSPGIPQSGRLSPSGLPVSPRLLSNRGLSPTPRLSPIPQLSPMPGYSPLPRDDDRDVPPRGASRSDQVPTFVIHNPPDSSHARMPSDTSTVVSDEVEAGLSDIILSPSKSHRRPPNSPRVSPYAAAMSQSLMCHPFCRARGPGKNSGRPSLAASITTTTHDVRCNLLLCRCLRFF